MHFWLFNIGLGLFIFTCRDFTDVSQTVATVCSVPSSGGAVHADTGSVPCTGLAIVPGGVDYGPGLVHPHVRTSSLEKTRVYVQFYIEKYRDYTFNKEFKGLASGKLKENHVHNKNYRWISIQKL